MNYYSGLPLFPLMAVLFPGQVLRLHIFESRYHQMVNDCMAGDGMFGVALIKKGLEVGDPAEPFPVGVTSKIHEITPQEDGSLDLICSGKKRFLINSLGENRPYLTCDAELWPWSYNPDKDDALAEELKTRLTVYLKQLSDMIGSAFPMPQIMPADTFNLACLTAISLKIGDLEKQNLLTTHSLADLARGCNRLLKRENMLLRGYAAVPESFAPKLPYMNPN